MAGYTERTFGIRLINAKKILTILSTWADYKSASPELSLENINTLISTIEKEDNDAINKRDQYAIAFDKRQKLFKRDEHSIDKLMSPIIWLVRSSFGKTSKEAEDIKAIRKKMIGLKVSSGHVNSAPMFVKQYNVIYTTLTDAFEELVAALKSYGEEYSPADDDLSAEVLQTTVDAMVAANNEASFAYNALNKIRDDRVDNYVRLSMLVHQLKGALKKQYGENSEQYKSVSWLPV